MIVKYILAVAVLAVSSLAIYVFSPRDMPVNEAGSTRAKMRYLAKEMESKTKVKEQIMSDLRFGKIVDSWGTEIRLDESNGGEKLISAGPDKIFDSLDDITITIGDR